MTAPTVSVCLPVFNGERFLGRALDTLLAQDFEDFELVISDNGSTDATEDLCRLAAARDRRIRYERQDENRGASWNFNRVRAMADRGSRYLKWAAADDEHAPTFLSRTVAVLDDDPTVALAHTGSADIDEEGYVLRVWRQPTERLASDDPAERIRDLVTLRHECFGAFGLIRHEVVDATRGLGAFSDSDNVLLVEVALRGRMVHLDDVLFFRRQHAERSTVAFAQARGRVAWFEPSRAGAITFPAWRVGRELVRAVDDAPLSPQDRRRCYRSLGVFLSDNWQGMAKNVVRSSIEAPRHLVAAGGTRVRTG